VISKKCLDVWVWSGILAELMLPVQTLIDQRAKSRSFEWWEIQLVPEQWVRLNELLELQEHDIPS
jgi:hypothetical protein